MDTQIVSTIPPSPQWTYEDTLFTLATLMQVGAGVAMVVHAVDAYQQHTHRILATPILLVLAYTFKIPGLWKAYKQRTTTTKMLQFWGNIVALVLWLASFVLAIITDLHEHPH